MKEELQKKLIFVYGTLKTGQPNHILLENSKKLHNDMIDGRIYCLGNFPGLKQESGTVYGEIYEVDDNTLEKLDRLEGHPNFYTRQNIITQKGIDCQTYFYNHAVAKRHLIASGVW